MSACNMQQIALRLKQQREYLGYSYQDLARLTGMSKSTLQRYETGYIQNLPMNKIGQLALALEVTPGFLLGWDEEDSSLPASHEAIMRKLKQLDDAQLAEADHYLDYLLSKQTS